MVAVRFVVPLLLVIGLALCEDKTDKSKRPKKDIGLKIRESLAASEQDSSLNNLGTNLGVGYQQPSYSSSFGYQLPSYSSSFGYQQPSYGSSFGYQQPSYGGSFGYQQPSYGSGFGYQPQITTSSSPFTYYYKHYKYHYPTTGLYHQSFHTIPQTYSHFATPQYYAQNYYSSPSSNVGLQTDALLQPYSGSYLQSYPDSSLQNSLYSGSTYQQPLTSSYSGNDFQQSLSDSSYQHSYQSYPSTSYQTYPASSDYSSDNKDGNSYHSSGLK